MLLGATSQALLLEGFAERSRGDAFTIVRTPSYPNFWYGNYLELDEPPAPDEIGEWLERAYSLALAWPGVARAIVCWETGAEPHVRTYPDAPDADMNYTNVLVYDGHEQSVEDDPRGGVLPADDDEAWRRVIEIAQIEVMHDFADDPTRPDFERWRLERHRDAVRSGVARYLTLREGNRIVAFGGLYRGAQLCRFGTPFTERAYRRRGYFSALARAMIAESRAADPKRPIVIAVDMDGPPEPLYRSLGFQLAARGYDLARSV